MMHGMGWGMMVACTLLAVLILLAIAALIKYLIGRK
jgi:hypothetical protein